MRSPQEMSIIQIDITNACVHQCSNCTRFCGHHKQNFFMDFDYFKKAVDSLDEFQGIVGIIGGEPTLHPEFEKFVDYLREKRVKKRIPVIRKPIHDMQKFIQEKHFGDSAKHKRVGLWCSLNKGYYKHFEVINDTFEEQLLNDHDSVCTHQALLMPRKDLGIDDEEWIKKRDACWIQNSWSATITPKGAFFCEVAGSLDMLFDGEGGWKVEPGWWKRQPKDFGEQLKWCETCSGCLDVPQRISNDERDDITPQMRSKLEDLGSPKIKRGMYVEHATDSYDKNAYHTFTTAHDYIDAASGIRTSKENRNLYPKEFISTSWDKLSEVLNSKKVTDWVLVDESEEEAAKYVCYFEDVILNPGCIYTFGNAALLNVRAISLREVIGSQVDISQNVLKYYPLDKIISVDLEEMQRVKNMETFFSKMTNGNRMVIYGAGKIGRQLFAQLLVDSSCKICGWLDKNYMEIGYPVQPPERLSSVDFDYILIAIKSEKIRDEIKKYLLDNGVEEKKILWGYYEGMKV